MVGHKHTNNCQQEGRCHKGDFKKRHHLVISTSMILPMSVHPHICRLTHWSAGNVTWTWGNVCHFQMQIIMCAQTTFRRVQTWRNVTIVLSHQNRTCCHTMNSQDGLFSGKQKSITFRPKRKKKSVTSNKNPQTLIPTRNNKHHQTATERHTQQQ